MGRKSAENILFVCTGNIFRSMTAEYALRAHLTDRNRFTVSSAGTHDFSTAQVRDDVASYLQTKGIDVSGHMRRTLTHDHIRDATHIIAMNDDHKAFLLDRFSVVSPLFSEACGNVSTPLPDVDDLFAPEDRHSLEAQQHIYLTIDKIIDQVPNLARRLTDAQ